MEGLRLSVLFTRVLHALDELSICSYRILILRHN